MGPIRGRSFIDILVIFDHVMYSRIYSINKFSTVRYLKELIRISHNINCILYNRITGQILNDEYTFIIPDTIICEKID